MTAQFSETIKYEGECYDIVGTKGRGLFDPRKYGMQPISWSTLCWQGYLRHYLVENQVLYLTAMEISLTEPGMVRIKPVQAPIIEGHSPFIISSKEKFCSFFEYRYKDMHLPIPFTGDLLIAAHIIAEYSRLIGFHPAWEYLKVYELKFKKGRCIEYSDVSDKIDELRYVCKHEEKGMSLKDRLEWINKCFSRHYPHF